MEKDIPVGEKDVVMIFKNGKVEEVRYVTDDENKGIDTGDPIFLADSIGTMLSKNQKYYNKVYKLGKKSFNKNSEFFNHIKSEEYDTSEQISLKFNECALVFFRDQEGMQGYTNIGESKLAKDSQYMICGILEAMQNDFNTVLEAVKWFGNKMKKMMH